MKLPKRYQDAKMFADACSILSITPLRLAELCVLAERAKRAGERACNNPDYDADPARERFVAAAFLAGFFVQWSGLYPTCLDSGGIECRLPILE